VGDDLYRATVETLGERGVVELVGLLGYYALNSMTLNTFEIGPPSGTPPELEP
jgi:4-carboxymuconolactone decarboxylase